MTVKIDKVVPDYLVVPTGAPTAPLTITWDDFDLAKRRCFSRTYPIGTAPLPPRTEYYLDRRWSRVQQLAPGWVLEFEVYDVYDIGHLGDPSNDPRLMEHKHETFLSVAVQIPRASLIIRTTVPMIGGTFYARRIIAAPLPASPVAVWLEVGEKAIVRDAFGIPKIPLPAATAFSAAIPGIWDHMLEATSDKIIPGTNYNAVVRLVDNTGAMQILEEAFTTKRRQITVHWTDFVVLDDSDNDGLIEGIDHGEIKAWFQLYIQRAALDRVSEFSLEDQISDKMGMNIRDLRPLNSPFVSPLLNNEKVFHGTEAKDDDDGGPTDHSNSFPVAFNTPFGMVLEKVTNAPFQSSGNDEDLIYTAHGVFSVNYV